MIKYYDSPNLTSTTNTCLDFVSPKTKVLEFGSATGAATKFLHEILECCVTCIEINPNMADLGRPYAEKMIVTDIETFSWVNEIDPDFDYIIFSDVLEHLRNPQQVIQKAVKFLKKDGFILSSIPNIGHNSILMSLRNGEFKYTETGLLDNTHIYFMTRNSITNIFESNHLYCVAEQHKIIRPYNTEFKYHYFKNPLLALSIIRKPDAHIYRYVHKWGYFETNPNNNLNKPILFNCVNIIIELLTDSANYIKNKFISSKHTLN